MTTLEKSFIQIFERKNWIIEKVQRQADAYTEDLASRLLIDGITPPRSLLNQRFNDRSSDPHELKKEEIIPKLILKRPQDSVRYSNGGHSLNDKPVVARGNGQLSMETNTDGLENAPVSKAEDEEFNEMINITNTMVDDVEHSAILCGSQETSQTNNILDSGKKLDPRPSTGLKFISIIQQIGKSASTHTLLFELLDTMQQDPDLLQELCKFVPNGFVEDVIKQISEIPKQVSNSVNVPRTNDKVKYKSKFHPGTITQSVSTRTAPAPLKRDIRVKALESAKAAKHRQQEKERERDIKKEAFKIEKAARKRQREEDERKAKNRKIAA